MRVAVVISAGLLATIACAPARAPVYVPSETHDEAVVDQGERFLFDFDDGNSAGSGASPAKNPGLLEILGSWEIERDDAAVSPPNVYRQTRRFGANDAPRAIVSRVAFEELHARVKCRLESGDESASCGIMFHVEDIDDYFVAYADAALARLVLAEVRDGKESVLACVRASTERSVWHSLSVTTPKPSARWIHVAWDGTELITADYPGGEFDGSRRGGRIGLWTHADAITAFDDLEAIGGVVPGPHDDDDYFYDEEIFTRSFTPSPTSERRVAGGT
jgi:hypothetical protein